MNFILSDEDCVSRGLVGVFAMYSMLQLGIRAR